MNAQNIAKAKILRSVEVEHFALKHYDTVGPFVDIMLNVYRTCCPETTLPINLHKAHDHVYGNNETGHKPCSWCKPQLEFRVQQQQKFIS